MTFGRMNEMKIDLSGEITFKDSELELANNINYIYGQNGAGKSTIAKLIVAQNLDKDVRVFDGFEGLLGDNHRLNAVVLGEENKRIDAQIEVKKNEIQILEEEKRKINAAILKPADGSDNLWTEWSVKSRIVKDLEKTVEDFYSSAAAKIRNRSNPQVAAPSYDKRNFKADVARASLLDAEQIKKYESIMKSTVKTAVAIKFPEYDFAYLLNSVNAILEKKVEEKVRIDRLNTQEKKNFADTGRRIHVKGDLCAFCGNLIKDSVFDELEKFFSADEVKALQGEIKSLKTKLETASLEIESCVINKDSFYDIYAERLGKLENDYTIIREGQVNYINTLISALCKKEASLFETTDKLSLELPETFENVEKEYESLAAENNANTLSIQQNEAKEKLRLHYAKMELDIFKYDVKNQEIVDAKKVELDTKSKIDVENEKIVGTGGIDEKISKLGKEISDLIKETKNEKKLAENINFKLKSMVSFELIPIESEDGQGYYEVKSLIDSSVRDIRQLSTGEKNIIAFLYFVEKLNEIIPDAEKKTDRIIVFDDPMSSNDDNMQYLMMSELLVLIHSLKKQNEMFLLLTHNKHFYLNITYGNDKEWSRYDHFHMDSDGKKTTISKINKKEQDFKTSYESLWHELKFLYENNDVPSSMLLNPIRRINETYYRFYGISANSFYKDHPDAKKLFDVNSHSIDDLEAELNGKTKDQIITLMRSCYESNNATSHFQIYWPLAANS